MTFTPEQKQMLAAPLDRAHVKHRRQAGLSLSYLEGWHCIAEANRIFGFDGWNRETVELRQVADAADAEKHRVAYMARVRITVYPGLIRDGSGFGSGIDRDPGAAHEKAIKEAETDAMKRALMTFGNPFGLALYDKDQTNVADAVPVSSAQAKRDGAWEVFTNECQHCATLGELDQWRADRDADLRRLPKAWLTEFAEVFRAKRKDLMSGHPEPSVKEGA